MADYSVIRKLAVAGGATIAVAVGYWNIAAAEYFGRIDPDEWVRTHPTPPPPESEPGRHRVEVISTRRIVPSTGLPPEVRLQQANNNLDVVRHTDGRVYLAWRTAPHHFASTETAVNVVSSDDEEHWRFEARFAIGRDLREPRFLSFGDRLFLYVARLGSNPFAFQPDGLSMAVRSSADGSWSSLDVVDSSGFIAWRVRMQGDRPLMIGYLGGGNVYALNPDPIRIEMLTSVDGRNWLPFASPKRTVLEGGGSEADFAFASDGTLFSVVRNEAGDGDGFGSKVCKAEPGAAWRCATDRKKYDSPLMFGYDGEIYVVARRNATASGNFDVSTSPRFVRSIRNQLSYITTPKRCSLWRLDRERQRLAFVLDLPSRGDTCFPSMLPGPRADEMIIYDYSSDLDGPDLPWAAAQRRPTYVERHVLKFSPAASGEEPGDPTIR